MAAPQKPPQVFVLPLTDPALTGRNAAGWRQRLFNGAPMIDLEEYPETVAMVFPRSPESARVVLEDELHDAFSDMQQKTRYSLPAWAAVNVRMKPGSFVNYALPLRLASLGEDIAEVLSVEDMGFCVIETGPREKGWLLRDYYRLVWWAVALIGTALLTSIGGLWLVRHTLERERKLGEMKSQFVSSVSHELRAPVGSMRLMAEALASGKVSGPPADEFHRLMASEGARLSGLIENVLDFARIEQGRKRYAFAETDVGALVRDAVKLMTPQAEERRQKILTDLRPLPFVPQVDAPALQQALINLLENALKFSPVDTEVSVALSDGPSRNMWSLSVTDHGAGVPKAEHTRIFERFYRPGNELRRETTGTGIGLAIVKHVVEGHGGRISVNSEPGKGSVFTMEFPLQSAHP
jgi:signal transduction histidine kinase